MTGSFIAPICYWFYWVTVHVWIVILTQWYRLEEVWSKWLHPFDKIVPLPKKERREELHHWTRSRFYPSKRPCKKGQRGRYSRNDSVTSSKGRGWDQVSYTSLVLRKDTTNCGGCCLQFTSYRHLVLLLSYHYFLADAHALICHIHSRLSV